MAGGAYAGRGHTDLARVRLGVCNEFGDRFDRKGLIDQHDVGHPHDARNRRNIADEVEFEICIERGVARIRKIGQEDRIAVGTRIHDGLGGDVAACARPVLNDERLAEPLLQPLTHQTREGVVSAAWGIADNPVHRPAWIGLRPRDARQDRQRGSARCQMHKLPAGKFHRRISLSRRFMCGWPPPGKR
jgi:hypothetical protein